MLGMDRFETESLALLPGQRVRARILSHEAWGVPAQIIGHEHVGASVDMIEQFGRALDEQELEAIYPPVGTIIDAVVEQVRRMDPPAWVRLSIRPRDLKLFRWPCGFCGELVTLSPGGGGLILDVRSNDGPGSHTVISHRECLADRLHPDEAGERARALKVGKEKKSLASACSASARGLAVWPLRADTTVRGRLSSWRREVCGLRWPAGLGLLTGQLLRMVTGAGPGCCGHGGWPGGPGRPACRSWRVMVFSRPGVRRRPVAPCVST